jgi:protein-S-isoprenylcysteine O-methyltransferase Ste14
VIVNAVWLRYLGVLLFLLGFAWVVWSFLSLGKQHSGEVTIQKEHELITKGPYRWVRHPMYLGLIVFPLGIGLAFGSWIGMALPLLLIGLFVWRVRDEERLLQQEFGQKWDHYCQHTWRLIPYLY